jgi:hypothetical protein
MKPPLPALGRVSACSRLRSSSRSAGRSSATRPHGRPAAGTPAAPGQLICVDRRAPLLPIGSLMTCTISDWPSNTCFSMGTCGWPVRLAGRPSPSGWRLPHIGHMQEGGALQPDVDEGRLHARQHARHLAQVDIAHQAALERAFDVQLLHRAVFDHRDPGFLGRPVDQNVLLHVGRFAQDAAALRHGGVGAQHRRRWQPLLAQAVHGRVQLQPRDAPHIGGRRLARVHRLQRLGRRVVVGQQQAMRDAELVEQLTAARALRGEVDEGHVGR